jgi:hypothetical protein
MTRSQQLGLNGEQHAFHVDGERFPIFHRSTPDRVTIDHVECPREVATP